MPELSTSTVKHIIYNPDLLSKEELIACFVARQGILNRLLQDIHLEGDTGSPQHQLIVGRRGMGKTTLLRRIAYAIEDDPTLNLRWFPLTFREEQYNVVRLSDLWLNCIDSLSDRLEHQGDLAAAQALDDALDALPHDDDEALQRAALDLLLTESRRLDRRLVLLLDNIGMILSHLKGEDWRFREVLSACDRLLIIGASSHHLEATYNYDAAFYDFFDLHELSGLTTDETHAVLTTLAHRTHSPHVERLIVEQPARIKTLHVLTGGNPRTINLLFEILANGLSEDVEADLAQLLDRCTPLYKARLEALAPQAQQIVDAMATYWDPITAADLANITRLETSVVSAQLTRLVRDGVVEKLKAPFTVAGTDTDEATHRKLGYQLAERFFNIWHLMRSSRRVRRRLTWLVRFMSLLFTPEQLDRYASRQLAKVCGTEAPDRLRYAEHSLALAMTVEDAGYRSALEHVGLQALLDHEELRGEIAALLDLDDEAGHLKTHVERLEALRRIKETVLTTSRDWGDTDPVTFWEQLGGSFLLGLAEKEQIAADLAELKGEQLEQLVRFLDVLAKRWTRLLGEEIATVIAEAVREGLMEGVRDLEGALRASRRLGDEKLLLAVKFWFDPEAIQEDELERCREMVSGLAEAAAYSHLGILLKSKMGRDEEAEEAFRKAIELNPDYAGAYSNLGILLSGKMGRDEEAEEAFRKVIELDPDDAIAYNSLAWMFVERDERLDAALELAQKAVQLDPSSPDYTHTLATILAQTDRWPEAALHAQTFIRASDDYHAAVWSDIVTFFAKSVKHGHAREAAKLIDDNGLTERWRPLREALVAIAVGDAKYLDRVAPEIRQPALMLMERLQ